MLSQEEYIVITTLHKHGAYIKDIAAELNVHPKTVSRAIARGGAPRGARQKRGSKLDAYKPQVDGLLDEGVWNAVVIYREITAAGYMGGMTILRQYIAPKRALRAGRATVRFETQPGEQLQTDWGELYTELSGVETKVYFMVSELGYSRRFHFWCTTRKDAEHTYEGLIRSLEYFGGVPQEVLVDNQSSAVLVTPGAGRHYNPRFVDLAQHYGFTPRACRPYRARTKGKDERMVGYIKQHFFVRYRSFDSWAHLNQLAEQWLREEADQRVQNTVHERVVERFAREQPLLQALPAQRYDTAYLEYRRVGWDSYINVYGNRYSVPATLVGSTVRIRISLDDELRVYAADKLVAQHQLRGRDAGWSTEPEHHAALWEAVGCVQQRALQTYAEVQEWS